MTDTLPAAPLSHQIAAVLAEEIIRGDFAPGEKLGQDHIAQRFECSHVPAREALQQLVAMELAVAEPRRGVRVVDLDAADYRDVLDMRLALEPMALALAIERLGPDDLRRCQSLREACDGAEDAVAWERANRDFHMAILEPCARPRLLRHVQTLQRLSAGHFHAKWRAGWTRRSDPDHAAILAAMADRDAPRASALLRRHLSRG